MSIFIVDIKIKVMGVVSQIISLKGQLEYVENVLKNNNLQKWEKKEYQQLKESIIEELECLENYVEEHKEFFPSYKKTA